MPQDSTTTDEVIVVVAHGLLASMTVVLTGLKSLKANMSRMSTVQQLDLINMSITQAELVMGILGDFARGLSPEALLELQSLRKERGRR